MRWEESPSCSKSWRFRCIYFSMHPLQSGVINGAPALALPACCSLRQRSLETLFAEVCSNVHCIDKRHQLQSLWWSYWRPRMNQKSDHILLISSVTVWSLKNRMTLVVEETCSLGRRNLWDSNLSAPFSEQTNHSSAFKILCFLNEWSSIQL